MGRTMRQMDLEYYIEGSEIQPIILVEVYL